MATVQSQGTTFHVYSAASAWLAVGQVRDINGPSGQAPVIDVTDLSSTRREKNMGLPDEGQITLSCFWDPADTGQDRLQALRNAQDEGTFKITFTDSGTEVWTFAGYVLSFNVTTATDNVVTLECAIEITGEITIS